MIKYFEITKGTPSLYLADASTRQGIEIIAWVGSQFASDSGSDIEIAQELGNSETKVVSQKVVTENINKINGNLILRPIVLSMSIDATQTEYAALYATLDKYLNDDTPFVVQMNMGSGIVEMTTIGRYDADITLGATINQTYFEELTEDGVEIESANIQQYMRLSSDGTIKLGQSLDAHNRIRLKETLSNKANIDGDYPLMSVGVADNLVGRGEGVDAMFSYRASGGALPSGVKRSINSGTARIRSIKGNSVVVNQIISKRNADKSFALKGITATDNRDGSFTIEGTAESDFIQYNLLDLECVAGHKYYYHIESPIYISLQGSLSGYGIGLFTATSTISRDSFAMCRFTAGVTYSGTYRGILRDLTQMFGAGNEPTTVEEYYARVGELPDEYDAGTLRDMQVSAIETTGFNQFNGTYAEVIPNQTYYLGGTYTSIGFASTIGGEVTPITNPSNKLYTPTEFGYIYAEGSDICINLSHSGYLDGRYVPYEVFRRALPDLSKYFEGGVMRRAGNVCDELRFNPTSDKWEAVQAVAQRAYASGDENDAAVTTDGTTTNYELAEPIVTPVTENLNLIYEVNDFGTERAIQPEDSAPFSADIVYGFNAVDTIRTNAESIEQLFARVAELESKIATTSEEQ